jgi:lipopolysaccharide/colanic/teichoic acid biosynthesis glycosyltransferase
VRRGVDLFIALIALIPAAPLIAFAALGIRLSSAGPVFFRAKRIGRAGEPFTMYKLRTMHHENAGAPIAAPNDPRVFKFGSLLRMSRIDELPQLFNILRGEMALVGPRPEDPQIVSQAYDQWMLETLDVRPGLTGPGTLFALGAGVDSDAPVEVYLRDVLPKRLSIEIAYAKRATILSDAYYLLKTFQTLISILLKRPLPAINSQDMQALQSEESGA